MNKYPIKFLAIEDHDFLKFQKHRTSHMTRRITLLSNVVQYKRSISEDF